jgi:hypothetical protein
MRSRQLFFREVTKKTKVVTKLSYVLREVIKV